jgi:hypothetical protein
MLGTARALEQQERELSELRARTNTIIAAAALSASFLGAAAIREHGGLSAWSIVALAVLVLDGALSLVVRWPRRLGFVFDVRETYAELHPLLDDVAEARLRVAYGARRPVQVQQAHDRPAGAPRSRQRCWRSA